MEELVHLEETGKKLYLIMTYESMGLWLHTGILIDTTYGSKICKARLLLVTLDLPGKSHCHEYEVLQWRKILPVLSAEWNHTTRKSIAPILAI